MKVLVRITEDSWNSYPTDELEFIVGKETVSICILGESARTVSINKEDFARLAGFCKEDLS